MKNRQLALTLGSIITGILICFSSCKKINESSEIGGDLIPPIDNINTFDTTITVEAYNGLFTIGGTDPLLEDSTRTWYTDEQWLGLITNDPIFGRTDARMFFELKPQTPLSLGSKPDSLNIDSIVLVLDYIETYGDTTAPQTVNVYELGAGTEFRPDSPYLIRKDNGFVPAGLLGTKTFRPENLKDSVKVYKDTTARQLRIPLDNAFGTRLLRYDSIGTGGAYNNDSAFTTKFKGFALQSVAGNAIMGFDLQGVNTKLVIYYKDDHGDAPIANWDTLVAVFNFRPYANTFMTGSGVANYIQRDYSGKPILAAQGGTTPDQLVFIQNAPGSYATIKIPALAGLNNRVVHRAELIAEQVYDLSDSMFGPPPFLYLDAFDAAISKFRTIPYDVVYDGSSGSINYSSFGIAPVNAQDGAGHVVRTWHFNLTRYVQHVVNDTEPVYDLRLSSPFSVRNQYKPPIAGASYVPLTIPINPAVAKGRVRLWGNTDPLDPNPRRMRLRIIYSKL